MTMIMPPTQGRRHTGGSGITSTSPPLYGRVIDARNVLRDSQGPVLRGNADTETFHVMLPVEYTGPFCEGKAIFKTLDSNGFAISDETLRPGEWGYVMMKVDSFKPDVTLKLEWEVDITGTGKGRNGHLDVIGEISEW